MERPNQQRINENITRQFNKQKEVAEAKQRKWRENEPPSPVEDKGARCCLNGCLGLLGLVATGSFVAAASLDKWWPYYVNFVNWLNSLSK